MSTIAACLSVLAVAAIPVSTAVAETRVTGETDPAVPLEIEPLSDPLVDGESPIVMWVQKLPATRTVSRITVGDVAIDPARCSGDSPWRLVLFESLEGQLFFANGGRQVQSVAARTITSELGRVTWTIPPTTLYAGRGYWVELAPEGGCRDLLRRTWAHDGVQVNSGPHTCVYNSYVKEHGRPYRMWHEPGQDDSHPQCVFGSRADGEPLFDPAMPAGWLTTISYNGDDRYVARRWTGLTPTIPCGDTKLSSMGLEEAFWRTGPPAQGDQVVCRWTQFAPPGQEVTNGWYYALYWTKARNGAPRDMYLKLELVPEDLAAVYRPNLYFDSSEQWRPLDVDRFFAETDHQLCGGPSGCVNLSNPDDIPRLGGTFIDIAGDGDGSNYKSPFEECNQLDLRDCDIGPRSAAYFRLVPDAGYNFLDYWFFYRFNDAPAVGDSFSSEDLRHEGDFESVTVGIAPGAQTFDFASFSQHGHWYSYLRSALRCDGGGEGSCGTDSEPRGTRVSAFVANRSHANYPSPCSASEAPIVGGQANCTQDSPDANLVGSVPLPEGGGHDGAREWGNNDVATSLLAFPSAPERFEWQAWSGRWGATDSSPVSPAWQPHRAWDSPGSFECPRRDSPCAESSSTMRTPGSYAPDRCDDWFGLYVAALLCDERGLRTALNHGRLGREGPASLEHPASSAVEATAPGVAQAVSRPLEPGERLVLKGTVTDDAVLRVRLRVGTRVITRQLHNLGQGAHDEAQIVVRRDGSVARVGP